MRRERGDQSPLTDTTTRCCSRLFFLRKRTSGLGALRIETGAPVASMPPGGTTAVQLQFGMEAVVPPSATGAPVAPGVAPCLRSGHDCESGDAPVLMTGGFGNAHLLALPIELLVQVLASLSGLRLRAILWQQPKTSPEAHPSGHCDLYGLTIGHALAAAGACCKAFAVPVHEAATIIAGGHGWRLPVVGSAPKHLSKLEQDTRNGCSFTFVTSRLRTCRPREANSSACGRWRLHLASLAPSPSILKFGGSTPLNSAISL